MKIIVIAALVCVALILFVSCATKDNPETTGMPDPGYINDQKGIKKANIVYGTDKIPITLFKPDGAYFNISPAVALAEKTRVSIMADDSSWSAVVFGTVCYDDGASGEDFAQFYYNGKLHDPGEKYDYFRQQVTETGATYADKPVKLIKSTYKYKNSKDIYESRFVGFEFEDTSDGVPCGKGLMGLKIYDRGKKLSDNYLSNLFKAMFTVYR